MRSPGRVYRISRRSSVFRGRVFGRHTRMNGKSCPTSAQLRFHLSELGSRDAHHEFEHLARHLARARIYSNILPATGPVSAGGDGGRDFETFRTGIALPVAGSLFSAHLSRDRAVAFACSLEKRIERKIRGDVEKIVATGKVDEIIYFCEANLAIAKRRELVTAASGMGAQLQIFDGKWRRRSFHCRTYSVVFAVDDRKGLR